MGFSRDVLTVARWELKRSAALVSPRMLPFAAALLLLLVAAGMLSAGMGIHLQDGMYLVAVGDQASAEVLAGDPRFVITDDPGFNWDLSVVGGRVYAKGTARGRAAAAAFSRDYQGYSDRIYIAQEDLYAAYPLWIGQEFVDAELNFTATQSGTRIGVPFPRSSPPVPDGPVAPVEVPAPATEASSTQLRQELEQGTVSDTGLSRYAGALAPQAEGNLRVPSQLSPPLPFDTIVLVFVFIFPLYFGSQFFMMAVMNERIGRQGEALLSSPVKPAAIVIGKALPYAAGMLVFSAGVTAYLRAPPVILAALVPVVILFLGAALIIGMVSRSFRELSFLSIFFSTVATSYLFFPSIFANIHSIALVSPLTLIVLSIQGTGFTGIEYVYSTALFFIAGTVLFTLGIANFREEPLFSYDRIIPKLRDFLGTWIPDRHRMLSLVFLGAAVIPFVFLVQMMLLVLVFNLPLNLSLPLLIVSAAFVEELAKSTVLAAAVHRFPSFLSWRTLLVASCAIAAGFLFGEKLLLFVSLSEITGSVFGTILFTSLQALWLPFLLHATGVLTVGAGMKAGRTLGRPGLGFVTGLAFATAIHFAYNAAILRGGLI